MSDGKSVGIVGAGMAGLTAALRLAERGFHVTLFEQDMHVGGLLSAHTHDGKHYHEHCYHMFLNWYHNFWDLVEDVGLDRSKDFEPRSVFRYMYKRADGRPSATLTNPGSAYHALSNIFSGVAPPPDMFLAGYALVDLLTQQFQPGRLLDQYSVNSFMQSRPYASEHSAMLHDSVLTKAFAVPSYLTSASSYKSLMKFGLHDPDPMLWALKDNVEEGLLKHLFKKLKELDCKIHLNCHVTAIARDPDPSKSERERFVIKFTAPLKGTDSECLLDGGAPPQAPAWAEKDVWDWSASKGYQGTRRTGRKGSKGERRKEERKKEDDEQRREDGVDYLILAVPPSTFSTLLSKEYPERVSWLSPDLSVQRGDPRARGRRHATRPGVHLPQARAFKEEPMAALDLLFRRELPGFPREHVVLMNSRLGLTLIDNSQLWRDQPKQTALNVIASDYRLIAHLPPDEALKEVLKELKEYIAFDDDDIVRRHFQTNIGDELFINEVGSEAYRPGAKTSIPNLFLAGDYCKTVIDVVTVEGAVVSGLQAAQALQAQALADRRFDHRDRGAQPIDIIEPDHYPDIQLVILKLMLAPSAYVAKVLSWVNEQVSFPRERPSLSGALSTYSRMLFMPYEAAATLWRTGWDLCASVLPQSRRDR